MFQRTPRDSSATLWANWYLEPMHAPTVYFAGDTATGPHFDAFRTLRARHFVPIHWGTFDLSDEPVQEPPRAVRRYAADHGCADQVHVLAPGGSFDPDRPVPTPP